MEAISRATVYMVLALMWVTPVGAQLATPEAAIRAQVQGFYRDDRDKRWPDVLDHFWVGKITARWTAPTSNPAWVAAHPVEGDSACVPGEDHVLSVALIDDRWARTLNRPQLDARLPRRDWKSAPSSGR